MANRKLNSIKFPDIADTYILDADKVNFDDSETYASGSVGKALQNKANIDGSYEDLTAGTANQINTSVRANDKTPYLFRTSGGSVDIGDREYVNGIVGGTVAWNQIVEHGNFDDISGWQKQTLVDSISFASNVLTATINGGQNDVPWKYAVFRNAGLLPVGVSDHYYFCTWDINPSVATSVRVELGGGVKKESGTLTANSWNTVAFIAKKSSINQQIFAYPFSAVYGVTAPSMTMKYRNVMCIDLTQMFGSTIADYIYSLETATTGAGVAWFRKLFNKPYYAYNAGELKSVSGLVSHDMIGFNAWDEEWEVGTIDPSSGQNATSTTYSRTKNYIKVLPNTNYYLKNVPTPLYLRKYGANKEYLGYVQQNGNSVWTIPADTYYIRFVWSGTSYSNDICINISWDGSRNGEYEPYELHSYPLDSDLTLRGIPKLDANNNLYYDGDTYESDGTVTRKYAVWTPTTATVTKDTYYSNLLGVACFYFNMPTDAKGYNTWTTCPAVADKLEVRNYGTGASNCIFNNTSTIAFMYASSSADTTVEQAQTVVRGLTFVYELATPTTETADPYVSPQIVNDFGTEEYVDTRTVPVPVGHDTDYPINMVAKLEMAPNSPSGDGDYIVRQTNGTNEYVSLASNATIQNIISRLEALENA